MQTFRANGKLLIAGEYFVLDGAKAFALPTQRGQTLQIEKINQDYLQNSCHWISRDINDNIWFECTFDARNLAIQISTDEAVATRLLKMLAYAKSIHPSFLNENGLKITTKLEFERDWGLGSSSTLICTIAKWAEVNAFDLLFNSMKGSGYDIACGMTDQPIFYEINQRKPIVTPIDFRPSFLENIYFVHLRKKQNSREGIARYREKAKENKALIDDMSALSEAMSQAKHLVDFNQLMQEHEQIVSSAIELPRAKDLYFKDYPFGEVKSLGAWGGDFVMVTSDTHWQKTLNYFHKKDFTTILPYSKMIL